MLLAFSVLTVLVTSFFCSLSEASLLSVSRHRLHSQAAKSPTAALVLRMKESMGRPLAAVLILNTIANTGGAAVAGREYARQFGSASMALFTAAFTLAVLVLAEIVPKTLGVTYAERAVLIVVHPLRWLIWSMQPLTRIAEALTRLLGSRQTRPSKAASLEDLRAMAQLAVSVKALGREEQMIIDAASRLPRISVHDIMIHREDIVFLALNSSPQENLLRAQRSMHSRLLLCHNDLDDMLGVVNIKEVLWRRVQDPETLEEDGLSRMLGEALREPLTVEPNIDVSQLLQTFAKAHEHMAVVKKQDGQVVGIVTLEDIIEELVGEIDDEFDRSPTQQESLTDNSWRFGGGRLWSDVARTLGLPDEMPDEDLDLDGRFDLNDLSADRLRGKLRTGGTFTIGSWRFKVARMRRGKVLYVDVMRADRSVNRPPSIEQKAPNPV
ncbi:MAG: hemolysin family protein [Myxococcota bacterium]